MPTRRSAGILLHRWRGDVLEVLIAHMGGPYWAKKDAGAWSIPKGEYDEQDDPLEAALREFEEELGTPVPSRELLDLGSFRQAGGKVVRVWAAEGDLDAASCRSTTFLMEWPPRSGRMIEVPEVDRAEWTDVATARDRLVKGQVPALDALLAELETR